MISFSAVYKVHRHGRGSGGKSYFCECDVEPVPRKNFWGCELINELGSFPARLKIDGQIS